MSGICAHCGASLPKVRDAFCCECRAPLAEYPRDETHVATSLFEQQDWGKTFSSLTVTGRILASVAFAAGMVSPVVAGICLRYFLPPGVYVFPTWALVFGPWAIVATVVAYVCVVLRFMGIRIWRVHDGNR